MAAASKRQAGLRLGMATLLLCASLVPLAACGKKPGKIDAPPDLEEDTFPRKYPDPDTDPKPDPKNATPSSAPKDTSTSSP